MSVDEAKYGGVLYLTAKCNMTGFSGHVPDAILLRPGRHIIGRSNKADIKLSAEKDGQFIISRYHAAIIVHGESFSAEIEDLGALNGIFVNEVRVKSAYLKDGDILQFGGMSEVPVGKRLTGGDAAVRYIYRCSSSSLNNNHHHKHKNNLNTASNSKIMSPTFISGSKRGFDSNDSKEKRIKMSVPIEASNNSNNFNTANGNSTSYDNVSRSSVDKSLVTPVSSHSKANNINIREPASSVNDNINSINGGNKSSINNTVTVRIPANSFVLSPQATQELQQLREMQARHTVLLQQLLSAKTNLDTPDKNNIDTNATNNSILMCHQELKNQFNDQLKEINKVQSRHETILSHYNNDKYADKGILNAINYLTTLVTQLQHQQCQLQLSFNNNNNANNIDNNGNNGDKKNNECDKLRHILMTHVTCVLCDEVGVELCVLRCSHSVCALCLAAYLCPDEPALKQFATHPVTNASHVTVGIEHHVSRLACPACDIPLLPLLPLNTSLKVPVAFRSVALDEVVLSLGQDPVHSELLKRYDTRRSFLHCLFYPRDSDDTVMVSRHTRDTLASFMPLPEMLSTELQIQEEQSLLERQQKLLLQLNPGEEAGGSRHSNVDRGTEEHIDTDSIMSSDYCGEMRHSVTECPHNNNKNYRHEEAVEEVPAEANENDKDEDDEERDM